MTVLVTPKIASARLPCMLRMHPANAHHCRSQSSAAPSQPGAPSACLPLLPQAAPQLQIIIIACTAIQITNIDAAELEMQPLSDQDSNLLLQAGCRNLVSFPTLFSPVWSSIRCRLMLDC